jgi:uncharacterized protein YbaA (DUF1428 family)
MSYVDGYLVPVPKKKLKAYTKMAKDAQKLWRKHGAVDYKECAGDDLKGLAGLIPFPKAVKLKAGETLVFSYIVFKSKKHREQVNRRVHKDLEKYEMPKDIPFDVKRMVYGGFKTVVG